MAIIDGSTIIATDLNTAFQQFTSDLVTDAQRDGGDYCYNIAFNDITNVTDESLRSMTFVAPDDMAVTNVEFRQIDNNGFVGTLRISGFLVEEIVISETASSNDHQSARYPTALSPYCVLSKGSIYTITVETTNAVASRFQALLVLKTNRQEV